MTQRGAVLKYFKTHKTGLTSKEAIERFGCTRLSAVVADLEAEPYSLKFEHRRETVPTRWGRDVSVVRYILVDDGPDN